VSSPFDAAVIGSGPNGLCAAIALAQGGLRVVLYEAASTVGGGLRTAELTLPGFRHDVCSAVHPMAVSAPFLSSLPLADHGLSWIKPEAPLAHPLADGSTVFLEATASATGAALGGDGERWVRTTEPFVAGWDGLLADALAPLGLPRHPLLLARFGLLALRSGTGLGRRLFADEPGRALFTGIAAHGVIDLDQPASGAIGLMLGLAGHAVGWPIPRGGAQSLADALVAHFEELGGTVRVGTPIVHLDEVETTGPVFFDTGPRAMCRIAGDSLPARYVRALQRFRYGPGLFKIDYALSAPLPWRDPAVARAATVHLGGSTAEIVRSEAQTWRGEHPERPYCILVQPSLFDPTRAPAGQHTAWIYCHVPHGSTRDMQVVIEEQLERYAPGFRDVVLARHLRHTGELEDDNPNYVGGDVNGGAPLLTQLFTRPRPQLNPYATPNPRLFLCSASTPPGGGVHGMAGYHAVRRAGLANGRALLSGGDASALS